MRTKRVIASLAFWSGLALEAGMAWGQPATEKAESLDTQLPALDTLPPAKASALAVEHYYAGQLRSFRRREYSIDAMSLSLTVLSGSYGPLQAGNVRTPRLDQTSSSLRRILVNPAR